MANFVEINPSILRWAVDRSGLSVEDFKQPVGAWLSQESRPTYGKLEDFAKKAMVPFGYLFLSQPPEEKLPLPDYRTRTDDGVHRPSPNLLETIFDMQRRKEWMREYLLEEGHGSLEFVGSVDVGEKVAVTAQRIREQLGLSTDWACRVKTTEEALRLLRKCIEQAGILIFINGIVGNNTHRSLDASEFQGFVFADNVAPLIFVNGTDYKSAQMFTIAHELAHVWVGQGALFNSLFANSVDVRLEKYCNAVAAELLVPAELLQVAFTAENAFSEKVYERLGRQFKVSPIVIARRAQELKYITSDEFFRFYNAYVEQVPPAAKQKGGDFWLTQNVRLGKRFGQAVVAAAKEGRLSYSEAYELTHLHGSTFDKFVRRLRTKGNA